MPDEVLNIDENLKILVLKALNKSEGVACREKAQLLLKIGRNRLRWYIRRYGIYRHNGIWYSSPKINKHEKNRQVLHA